MPDQLQNSHSTQNHILNDLPDEDYQRIHPHLEAVKLKLGEVLYRPEDPIKYVYFPDNTMASLIATTPEGESAEVGVIGYEGIVGTDVLMGVDATLNECIIQLPGQALRVKVEAIKKEFKQNGAFHDFSLKYIHALMMQISQTALCNRLHPVEQRLSRWLLMCHDRSPSGVLTLTQEFLSIMLGVNRPSVTVTAILLQSGGFIRYTRGRITIVDRDGLEDFACDCYRVVRPEYDRLDRLSRKQ